MPRKGEVAPVPPAEDAWGRYVAHLGMRLGTLRHQAGLSQEQLAARAGITAFSYRKLERGGGNPGTSANPQLRTLAGLALALGVEIADLLPPRIGAYLPGP
jgi:transcriptional regulator with XRE-family HTH domain